MQRDILSILIMLKIERLFIVSLLVVNFACGDASRGTPFQSVNSAANLIPRDQVVVDYSNWLDDGASISWKMEPGIYRMELTANNDGATTEWVGGSCPKTQPMREMTIRCQLPRTGQLVVTNPTVFALGKAVSVTVKVTKLAQ